MIPRIPLLAFLAVCSLACASAVLAPLPCDEAGFDPFATRVLMPDIDERYRGAPPPRVPPPELVPYYTRCGAIPIDYTLYVDDSAKGAGTHYIYSDADIAGMVQRAQRLLSRAGTGGADEWLFEALRRIPLRV